MKKIFILLAIILTVSGFTQLRSQIINPTHWSYETQKISETEYLLLFEVKLDKDWHIYSQHTPVGGPLALYFEFEKSDNYKLIGNVEEPTPHKEYDEVFVKEMGFEKLCDENMYPESSDLNKWSETKLRIAIYQNNK